MESIIRKKVQEPKPEYFLEEIKLVCEDKDAWGPTLQPELAEGTIALSDQRCAVR